MERINLNALIDGDGGEFELDGVTHRVLPISGGGIQLLTGSGDALAAIYEVAVECVPTLSREQILKLTPKQVAEIVRLSQLQAQAVEASIPNGAGPATTTSPA